ncbi:Gfo/Idh/MocA family oxidoreductase [Paenibacillus aurantius]|uniref:Gfo/Idh/MocA family oxidoreductase n=1 Tax=Paenibacillus aurantius TaxID=2918900 RepID=A0AA96LCK6_9BACL|nr:Gfo/Idh/MocA family oxidoreductase [Paenibacillus aurantius]WNQ10669.1 Gfo/Idh/MocA family oxidoreductase [Paenibacillus aurantius]
MSRKFRFGIVGAGAITPLHAEAVQQQADAELVSICDIRKERAAALAETYGIPNVYDRYELMLQQDDLDVICICLPNGLHAEAGIAAAKAGKHIFCEKPLDVTVEKIDALIDACREHRVKLATVYQRRMMPEAIAARQWIREGKLGKLVLGELISNITGTKRTTRLPAGAPHGRRTAAAC